MDLTEKLSGRMSLRRICALSELAHADPDIRDRLLGIAADSCDRMAYNALWTLSHLPEDDCAWLCTRRGELIDLLLETGHTGRRRLLLSLLDRLPAGKEDVRSDYLDFCLSRINSREPYGIRALCIKQALSQCRYYAELMREFENELELMRNDELSPGLKSAMRNAMKEMEKIRCPHPGM